MDSINSVNSFEPDILFIRDLQKGKLLQTTNELDIYDGTTSEIVFRCRDTNANLQSKGAKVYGGSVAKAGPFDIQVSSDSSNQFLRIARKAAAFKVHDICLYDENDGLIGFFRQPFFALGRTYRIISAEGKVVHVLQIKPGLNVYRVLVDKKHVATVHLNWKGVNQSFFKEHCKVAIQFQKGSTYSGTAKQLTLGTCICLDILK